MTSTIFMVDVKKYTGGIVMDLSKYVIVIYFNNGSIFQTDKISKTEADKINDDFNKRKNIKYDVKTINSDNIAMIETITEEVYEKRIMSNKFKKDFQIARQ